MYSYDWVLQKYPIKDCRKKCSLWSIWTVKYSPTYYGNMYIKSQISAYVAGDQSWNTDLSIFITVIRPFTSDVAAVNMGFYDAVLDSS